MQTEKKGVASQNRRAVFGRKLIWYPIVIHISAVYITMCDCVVNLLQILHNIQITYFFCKVKGRVPVCAIPNREKGVAHQTEELTTV